MINTGDHVWVYIYALPDHPDTQYDGIGAGDFTHTVFDKFAVAVREVEVVKVTNKWNEPSPELIRIRDPWAQVKDGKTGLFGPPMGRSGPEECQRVYTINSVYPNRETALMAACHNMPVT